MKHLKYFTSHFSGFKQKSSELSLSNSVNTFCKPSVMLRYEAQQDSSASAGRARGGRQRRRAQVKIKENVKEASALVAD